MFNNAALDVVIGLVFVYLLYSLLGTLIEEMIATNIGLRGIILRKAIRRMLDDDEVKNETEAVMQLLNKVKRILNRRKMQDDAKKYIGVTVDDLKNQVKVTLNSLPTNNDIFKVSDAFYEHPLIKYLSAGTDFLKKLPSYITKETFSKVVIDLLRGQNVKPGDSYRQAIQSSLDNKKIAWVDNKNSNDGTEGPAIEGDTLSYLKSIWTDSQGDVQRFQEYLEQWFNEMMDRTTGWYKKYTQLILLGVGLIIAGMFNVDTLKIISKLQKDPKLREQVISQANDFTKSHPNLVKELADTKKQIDSMGVTSALKDNLRITTDSNFAKSKRLSDSLYNQATALTSTDIKKINNVLALGWDEKDSFCATSIIGWILTALAISLGAPFWFDLLNKLMQLRSSVTSTDDSSKKPRDTTKKIKRVG